MRYLLFLALFSVLGCASTQHADLIISGGNIYTMDSDQTQVEAIAVINGRIISVGDSIEVLKFRGPKTEMIMLKDEFVMPGFIEGHGHFEGMGEGLNNLDFLKAENWDSIVDAVQKKAQNVGPKEWIVGRGWHQEKWSRDTSIFIHGYPSHHQISKLTPNTPVLLDHASGHAIFANAKAMELAGVNKETPDPSGGKIIRDAKGEPTGVFEENAAQFVMVAYQEYLDALPEAEKLAQWHKNIQLAEENCLKHGITSFQDAGTSYANFDKYKALAEKGELDVRLWCMLIDDPQTYEQSFQSFPQIGIGEGFLTCRAVKAYVDGALGSHGAWLLEGYHDHPEMTGQNVTKIEDLEVQTGHAIDNGLQMCIHAIGDRANREVLNIYEKVFEDKKVKGESLRFRIEHAQHLDPQDIPRFADLGVLASMQGIHCTSDAPYVVKRLGEGRAQAGAYVWKKLKEAGVRINNGTDVPVESIDPFENIYALVTRKRTDTGFTFFPEQSLSRQEALQIYTMANAYAAFEEREKGSLSVGKYADLIILDNNLMTCSEEAILETKVLRTIVNGETKFSR